MSKLGNVPDVHVLKNHSKVILLRKKKKKKATIYSHNMNKSQKHDGERDDIRTQLYEVLDRPHYHINMQKTATSIPYISAYMWNLEKMVQINLFPRQE